MTTYLPLSEETADLALERHAEGQRLATGPDELFRLQRDQLSDPAWLGDDTPKIEDHREEPRRFGDRSVLVHVHSVARQNEYTATTSLLVLDGERLTAVEYSVTDHAPIRESGGVVSLLETIAEDMGW
ncbi:hypothetical protein ACFPZ0_07195 [Streptomonospora nanhaiensis]|uniref:Uncharacterized protein n=1 Tax=Streptomonospora nanhaiensis TaxID=1323731 RepID=A0A853BRF6_9ACTN|nr:hypothetical protein [Streptomonospora nanhaiensis]MBX9387824.1 hypothetical protein [Streptomonospora nanhaiensis]NYI97315.1 hypothetical protein [Streptomonospora nanhaiensis]